MADHHKYTFYYTSQDYHEGWERIFGNGKDKKGAVKKSRRSRKGDTSQETQRGKSRQRKQQGRSDLASQGQRRHDPQATQIQGRSSPDK